MTPRRVVTQSDATIVAVDPGITGAYAIFHQGEADAYDTPVLTVTKSRKTMDLHVLWTILESLPGATMVIEEVNARPGMGVASMFNFGKNMGQWEALAVAAGMKLVRARPQEWKKEFHLIKKPKDSAIRIAQELFKNFSPTRKKDVNKADALLIGEYARRKLL